MIIAPDIQDRSQKTALTIGNFDGLHQGHMKIIKRLVEKASENHCPSLILTFDPHPVVFFNSRNEIQKISGLHELKRILEPCNVDTLIQLPFTEQLAAMTPDKFLNEVVIEKFNPCYIIVGEDHHFGKNREGNPERLKQLCSEKGIEAEISPQLRLQGDIVSSTRIRGLIRDGEIDLARELLGHGLYYTGEVQYGEGRGTDLGFPTANLKFQNRILPRPGVYITATEIDGSWHPSLSYVGKSPTFNGKQELIETFCLGSPGNLYGKMITVDILKFLRSEIVFSGKDSLVKQMYQDLSNAKAFLGGLLQEKKGLVK